MIKLTLLNSLTIGILDKKSILRITLDTSKLPFSFDLKLGLLYSVLPWYNNKIEHDTVHYTTNRVIDVLCPALIDLRLYIEQ